MFLNANIIVDKAKDTKIFMPQEINPIVIFDELFEIVRNTDTLIKNFSITLNM